MNKDHELEKIKHAAAAFHQPLNELFQHLHASGLPYLLNPLVPAEWAGRRTLTILLAPEHETPAAQPEATPDIESTRDRMKHFKYKRLTSERAQKVSKAFHDLALLVLDETAPGAEQASALRKLLEGKDAAVRAAYEMDG